VKLVTQANIVKSKVRLLCAKIDQAKEGLINRDVFFDLLELHKIILTSKEKANLESQFLRKGSKM